MSRKMIVPIETKRWILQRIFLELVAGKISYHKASGMRWKVQTLIDVQKEKLQS